MTFTALFTGTWLLVPFVAASAAPTTSSAPSSASVPSSLSISALRRIPVQHDGRWPPLDTVARDLIETVTGDWRFRGDDPLLTLLAMTFDPETWQREPLISISNAELRHELELSPTRKVFSYSELLNHERLRSLTDHLSHKPQGEKLDPLESKVSKINAKLGTLQAIFMGRVIKPIPHADDVGGAWSAITGHAGHGTPVAGDVNDAWGKLKSAFLARDAGAFDAAVTALGSALASLPAAYRPSPALIATELRYNRLNPQRSAWIAMILGTVLAAAALLARSRMLDWLALTVTAVGFVVLSYGIWMRWQIAGHIPASNMFESLLFLSWGMGAFAILSVFLFRHRLVVLTASLMGAVSLMLADVLPLDHFIRPTNPVLLDTVWMGIHVPVIMVSYSVLALGVLVAHVQLFMMAFMPNRRSLHESADGLHYMYIHVGSILLLAGIATGSMWAASSWGRYWGWDPKEVWSLVALLGYLTILHVRIDRERVPKWAYAVALVLAIGMLTMVASKLDPLTAGKALALGGTVVAMAVFVLTHGMFATAFKSILCFWLIIMTYVGVNYVLGTGLHSYGFGTGGVANKMFLVGGIDLGIVLLLAAIYLARRERDPGSSVSVTVVPTG